MALITSRNVVIIILIFFSLNLGLTVYEWLISLKDFSALEQRVEFLPNIKYQIQVQLLSDPPLQNQ